MKSNLLRRLAALILSALIGVSLLPSLAFADGKAADIKVYMTISDEGALAKAKDGSPMAWKEVTVSDIDEDGLFSFDEALVAAHGQYCLSGVNGYGTSITEYGVSVNRLWGVDASPNYLFFINGQGLNTGVGDDYVSDGDYLTASILSDLVFWSDRIASFDHYRLDVDGRYVTLNLKGHLGMAWSDEEKVDSPFSDIEIIDVNGKSYGKTDENGSLRIRLEKGTHILTAQGTVEGIVTSNQLQPSFHDEEGNAVYAKRVSEEEAESTFLVAFTEADYTDGPYPIDEIQYIDYYDWIDMVDEDEFTGHTLRSNQLINNCPIIAPVCIVNIALASIKSEAVQSLLDSYRLADYRTAQQTQILDLVTRAQAGIFKAETSSDVQSVLQETLAKIAAVKTAAQLTSEERAAEAKKVKATQVKGVKVKADKKKATVTWTKNSKTFTGYQIQYKKAGSKATTVTISKSTASRILKKLTSGKQYTFKVRGFKKIAGKNVYGKWSAVKKAKIK